MYIRQPGYLRPTTARRYSKEARNIILSIKMPEFYNV